ncbi:MAG TPA: S41 family peptidase [bacterium]|mgnify:FL=1|nr:S41 family peptidase [bacterium]HOH06915.1 S41 family peptidase [bacterium]
MLYSRKKRIAALTFGGLVVLAVLWIGPARIIHAAQSTYNKMMVLTMVLDKIERFYVDDRNPDELIDRAIDGILGALDPHSIYLTPDEFTEYKGAFLGYQGIGLKYNRLPEKLLVASVVPGGPAAEAGIRPGDKIMRISGKMTQYITDTELPALLQEPVVRLEIERDGVRDLLPFAISKRPVVPQTVSSAFMLDDSVAFIKLERFIQTTPAEFDQAWSRLRAAKPSYLILDLRDNMGGDLQAGVKIADRFLSAGKMISYTTGRGPGANMEFRAGTENKLPALPVIVLINGGSASDAEIVAGALQDWDRALIAGKPSFGKALVQSEFTFPDGSAMLLTTARFYTPLGRSLFRTGQARPQNGGRSTGREGATLRTPGGRLLTANGSIVPDVDLSADSLNYSPALRRLLAARENPLAIFSETYSAAHPELARDREGFIRNFEPPESLLRDFQQQARKMGVNFSAQDLSRNREGVRLLLKREIAAMMWGEEVRTQITLLADPQVRDCSGLWRRARQLTGR